AAGAGWRTAWWVAAAALAVLVLSGIVAAVVARARTTAAPSSGGGPPSSIPTVQPLPADPVVEELSVLRKAVANPAEDRAEVRRRVLEFRAKHPHGPSAIAAAGLLRRLPGPLDPLFRNADPDAPVPVVRLGEGEAPAGALAFTPTDERLVATQAGS